MTFTYTVDLDVLLASHLLESKDARILPDVPYFEHYLIRNIPKKSHEAFFGGRNMILQGVPEIMGPDNAVDDIQD